MTNPNPFVPKGSLLEQQNARRSRLKLGVFCVIAVSAVGLVAMLIQGCKREVPSDNTTPPDANTNVPSVTDTNPAPLVDTNPIAMPVSTNPTPVYVPPPVTPVAPVVDTSVSVYEVVSGDTLGKIAKAHHVSLKDLEAANPGVDSKHLKLKQKINIPAASGATATAATGTATADVAAAGDTYTVKSGDTLTTIAKKHGVTLKALKAANPKVDPNHIKVGDKLTIPAKADAAPVAAPAAAAPAPMLTLPASAPSAAPAAAPASTPAK